VAKSWNKDLTVRSEKNTIDYQSIMNRAAKLVLCLARQMAFCCKILPDLPSLDQAGGNGVN
jgi:hypothetical protein